MKKILKLGLWLLIVMSLTACGTSSSSDDVIEISSLYDAEAAKVELEKQNTILNDEERLDKDYRHGVYFLDFTEVYERLNREAEIYLADYFKENLEKEDILISNIEIYRSFLVEVEEKNYSFKYIIENHNEEIKSLFLEGIRFKDILSSDDKLAYKIEFHYIQMILSEEIIQNLIPNINSLVVNLYTFDTTIYEENKKLVNGEKHFQLYSDLLKDLSKDTIYFMNEFANKKGSSLVDIHYYIDEEEKLNELKEKYNESFDIMFSIGKGTYFAPKRNKNLLFSKIIDKDRYLSVLLQDVLSNMINKRIEEAGASEYITQFVAPGISNKKSLDVKKALENPQTLIDMFEGDLTFYYLKTPEEEVNYEKIIEVLSSTMSEEDVYHEFVKQYVFIYEVSEEDRQVLVELFKEARLSENYFRDRKGMDTWVSNWAVNRNDSDCFKFLDVFGTKQKMFLNISPVDKTIDSELYIKAYIEEEN